ncbi:porin [Noviherbaspirillum aridicola]|uniref:Porin n=1 Tax=Noviherbaspirillum aridicola TaxID=2849687 RepID=A0ABQ4Q6P4_9BURK|nr:porin [Noviherbaspirillum aridicola]GIZ52887.1 porin [Noviherbaspirillum aridicola]
MKKSLLALAVLGAFAGAAQSQTAITIYGVADAGVRHLNNANAAGDSNTTLNSGVNTATRLGFRGVEDLGGGLNARFNLEMGYDISTGTGTSSIISPSGSLFDRTATVGLGGAWGSLDLGLQYSVAFKTIGAIDPMNYQYTGIIPLAGLAAGNQVSAVTPSRGGTRFLNDIQYTGNFGPLTVRAEYALGEVAGSRRDGSAQAVGATFVAAPFTVAGAYTRRSPNIATAPAAAVYDDNNQWVIGAAFDAGVFRLAGGYLDEEQDRGALPEAELKTAWFGGRYSLTPAAALSAGYYHTKVETGAGDAKRKLFIVSGTYALSKRTTLYAAIDHNRYDGDFTFTSANTAGFAAAAPTFNQPASTAPAASQDKITGFSVGISHTF